MKTFIISICTAIVLFACGYALANTIHYNNTTANNAIDWYVEATTAGQVAGIDRLFGERFTYRVNNNGKITQFSKTQLVNYLQGHPDVVQQDCYTTYSVLEQTDECAIAKIEMKYKEFTRTDRVMLFRDADGWQISQVITSYR